MPWYEMWMRSSVLRLCAHRNERSQCTVKVKHTREADLTRRVAPVLAAHISVQDLGKRLGQAIRQCFDHDGAVVVVRALELGRELLRAKDGHGKHAWVTSEVNDV